MQKKTRKNSGAIWLDGPGFCRAFFIMALANYMRETLETSPLGVEPDSFTSHSLTAHGLPRAG